MQLFDHPSEGIRRPAVRRQLRAIRARRGFAGRCVWMLGSPRTGSTWLLQLLGEHEAVIPINEPLIGWYLSPFLSDLPGWSAERLTTTNFTLRRVNAHKRDHFFSEEFSGLWSNGLRNLMLDRFISQAAASPTAVRPSRTRIVIKEPNGSQSADVLMSAFPNARLLFLLRDGRDVVDSELAANGAGSWVAREFPGVEGIGNGDDRRAFVVQSAHKWLWRTEVVQDAFAKHPGPKLLVRYEDLRGETATELRRIFDWMGLEASDRSIDAFVERHDFEGLPSEARGPGSFFRAAEPGLWRKNLSPDEQALVSQIIGGKLAELGYA